jgi:hypothetical protein
MPGLRPTAMVTALCLSLLGTPAWAEPAIMVWPGEPGAAVAEAEAALRAEGVEVVPHARVGEASAGYRAAAAEREQAQRERVEAALGAAQQRYLELDLPHMLATLDAAEADAVALARPGRCEGLWELEFRQGLGRWARGGEGDEAEAGARFELALALDPERRPLGELYGPDVSAAFLRAVQDRSARFARPVPLRVQPADAHVEIDCRALDEREPSLLPGLHAVRVAAPGFRAWSGVVDLRARGSIEVALAALPAEGALAQQLADSTDTDAVDDGSTSAHALVLALARFHGAAAVLVVGRGEAGVRVRPWGSDGIGSAVERPALAPALHAAMRLLDDDGSLRAPAPVVASGPGLGEGDRRPTTPVRKPVVRTWWFWTIVGSVAITGGALALGLGLGLREPSPGRLVIVAR